MASYVYICKSQFNAAPLNAVSVLHGWIGISLNRTLYWYLLYKCANETAMHQPKAVHYIATVYAMYLYQRSIVISFRIKMPNVFHEVVITVHTHISLVPHLALSRLVLELIGIYPSRYAKLKRNFNVVSLFTDALISSVISFHNLYGYISFFLSGTKMEDPISYFINIKLSSFI